jgi:integration host factor subunit beta
MLKRLASRFSSTPRAARDPSTPGYPENKKEPTRFGFRAAQSRARYLRSLQIAEMFDAGKSVAEIAKAVTLTPTWVRSILDTTGVRQKGKRGPGIPLDVMPEIVQLNANGWSLREIGGKYRVSGEAIRQAIITWPKRKKKAAIAKRLELARTAKAAGKIPKLSRTTEYAAVEASAARRRTGPKSPRAPRAAGGVIVADLIDRLSERQNISLRKAAPLVAAFFECLAEALRRGERVEIRGFGVFAIRNHRGYRGRNPRTGQAIEIRPGRVVLFKASREFLKRLNAGRGEGERQAQADEMVAQV